VRKLRRVLLVGLAILLALPVAGALYQTLSVRSESVRFPAPGSFVNVAGAGERAERRLHFVCVGQGEPTVIFEPGGFGGALSSRMAREEVSAHTRVCSYDRMGMGWSDPGPSVISVGLLAGDLERLSVQAGLRPPFILVPVSFGGLVAELFTRRHPEQVAGLVSVDAANSIAVERFAERITRMHVASVYLAAAAARIGLLRLLDPFGFRKEPAYAAQNMAFLYRAEPMDTFCGIARGLQATRGELAAAPPLAADLPLTVLVHEKPDKLLPPGLADETQTIEREWLGLQKEFAQRSRRGTWRVVPGSDHLIASGQPRVVADAVLDMLAEVRRAASPR